MKISFTVDDDETQEAFKRCFKEDFKQYHQVATISLIEQADSKALVIRQI